MPTGVFSLMVEHLIVAQDDVGSTPIRHPDSPGGRRVNAVVCKTTLCKFNSYPGVYASVYGDLTLVVNVLD